MALDFFTLKIGICGLVMINFSVGIELSTILFYVHNGNTNGHLHKVISKNSAEMDYNFNLLNVKIQIK